MSAGASSIDPIPALPFLKWAGGKRWLSKAVVLLFADFDGRHVEPFAGSAACFFARTARTALLADNNAELVNCYVVLRDRPDSLMQCLSRWTIDETTFARIRKMTPTSNVVKAARFLYLNRTSFNGLYRVNQQGVFNVPFGCKPTTVLCNRAILRACSTRLAATELLASDFADTLKHVRHSDCIFIDPPYTVKHNNNAFRRYNERIFSWSDQERLAQVATRLAKAGHRLIITNACHDDVISLYSKQHFDAFGIPRPTNMAASPIYRGTVSELILVSHGVGVSRRATRRAIADALGTSLESIRLSK